MSGEYFTVVGENLKLVANWSKESGETSGELIINNISAVPKYYKTETLSSSVFSSGTFTIQPVVNGDKYNVRLLTNMGRNKVVNNVSGKTVPQKLNVVLEARNESIAIRLVNYSTALNESNGFDAISSFDVLIDNGDDNDYIQTFSSGDVENGRLVVDRLDASDPNSKLVNGEEYEIVVRAINSMGKGTFSDPTVIAPSEKPAQIANFDAVVSNASVSLSWSPALEEYDLVYHVSKKLSSASAWEPHVVVERTEMIDEEEEFITNYTFDNLVNGTSYDFKIIAVSDIYGQGLDSIVSEKIPFTIPDKMADSNIIITDLSNTSIFVRLTPPTNNGGKKITGYVMYLKNTEINLAAGIVNNLNQSREFIIPNLTNGVQNTFMVYAMNSDSEIHPEAQPVNYTQYANPSAVQNLQVVNNTAALSNNGSVKLTWELPADMGGAESAWFNHAIKYQPWVVDPSNVNMLMLGREVTVNAGSLLEYTISGLVVGKQHSFKIVSTFNRNGASFGSVASGSVSMIPHCAPGSPVSLNVAMDAADKEKMKITWSQPDLFGLNLSKYEYKVVLASSPNHDNVNYIDAELATQIQVLPPTYGVAYKVYVRAKTILHCSPDLVGVASEFTFTPYKAPSLITNFILYPLDSAVEVRWDAPEDKGGFTDIRYIVAVNGIANSSTSEKSVKLTGLKNEQVYIAVKPVGFLNNVASLAGEHVVASTYPYSDPEPPTNLSVVPGDKQVTLSWTASASAINVGIDDPAAPVISYIIFRNDVKLSGVEVANGVLTYTDNGSSLVNGTTYNYRVIAKQSFEDGAKITYSDNFTGEGSKSATPFKAPEPARNLNLFSSDKEITATWQASTSVNGLDNPAYYRVVLLDDKDVQVGTASVTTLDTKFSNLTNGILYTVKVYARALNSETFEGNLGWYENVNFISKTIKPNITPSSPITQPPTPGDHKITLNWTATADTYTTQNYKLFKNGAEAGTASSSATSYEFTGLTNGDVYSVGIVRVTTTGEESELQSYDNVIPLGLPVLQSLEVVTVNSKKQVKLIVNPNGSPINNFIIFAAPSSYVLPVGAETYSHVSAPITPALEERKANVELQTTQLNISSNITGVFYVVSNAAGILTAQTIL
jgi:hypothetical protein